MRSPYYWPQLAAYAALVDPLYVSIDYGLGPAWFDTLYQEALAHERAILMKDMQDALEENLMRPSNGNDLNNKAAELPICPLVQPIYGPQPPPPVTGVTITLTLAEACDLRSLLSANWNAGDLNPLGVRLLMALRGRL